MARYRAISLGFRVVIAEDVAIGDFLFMAIPQSDLNQIVQAVWAYFLQNGIKLDQNLILSPTTAEGWAQIMITALQYTGTTKKAGILSLADVLDNYAGNVEKSKNDVISAVNQAGNTINLQLKETGSNITKQMNGLLTDANTAKQGAETAAENAVKAQQGAEQAKNEAQAAARRLPSGIILPFAGLQSKQPQYTLFCDGSEVSRTTYADLFNTIGTTFGAGDGSTTFNLPDLITTADELDSGNFIRYGDWSKLGTKLIDAIRNIRGKDNLGWYGEYTGIIANDQNGKFGVFKGIQNSFSALYANQAVPILIQESTQYGIGFDANTGIKEDNPMVGHAVGPDIHPYSIYLVPLITY